MILSMHFSRVHLLVTVSPSNFNQNLFVIFIKFDRNLNLFQEIDSKFRNILNIVAFFWVFSLFTPPNCFIVENFLFCLRGNMPLKISIHSNSAVARNFALGERRFRPVKEEFNLPPESEPRQNVWNTSPKCDPVLIGLLRTFLATRHLIWGWTVHMTIEKVFKFSFLLSYI